MLSAGELSEEEGTEHLPPQVEAATATAAATAALVQASQRLVL